MEMTFFVTTKSPQEYERNGFAAEARLSDGQALSAQRKAGRLLRFDPYTP
jgi:hypothetical protein